MTPLSTNRQSKFRRCPREYRYAYIDGYEPIGKRDPLVFGTMVHEGLETWFKTIDTEKAVEAIELFASKNDVDAFSTVGAVILMTAYAERYKSVPWTVLGVEQEFDVEFRDHLTGAWVRLTGRLDAAIRDEHGRDYVVEHKTKSGDIDAPNYWQKLRVDAQVSNYHLASHSLGMRPSGVIYDVIAKPPKPHKATPEEKRRFTKPKSKACPMCKKRTAPPAPHVVDGVECCEGRIVTDPGGKLYASMRAEDETVEEYTERFTELVAESPDDYFRRVVVERSPEDEADALRDLVDISSAIEDATAKGRWPRNTDACIRFGEPCGYLPVCTREASLSDSGLYQLRVKDKEKAA